MYLFLSFLPGLQSNTLTAISKMLASPEAAQEVIAMVSWSCQVSPSNSSSVTDSNVDSLFMMYIQLLNMRTKYNTVEPVAIFQ